MRGDLYDKWRIGMSYNEKKIKLNELYLDQKNPRFSPAKNQREAVQAMLNDQGDKIVNLAADIYEYGLNPSSRLIVFLEKGKFIDGDGNRRLTALKILETPALTDGIPRIRKKIDEVLRKKGNLPKELNCVVFKNRQSAHHWILINHDGEQEGRGQIKWSPEQKDRFEGRASVGLEALDKLLSQRLISSADKEKINKTTLDRLLGFKGVKEKIGISKNGTEFTFKDMESLQKVVLGLRNKAVDEVYTAEKGEKFANELISSSASTTGTKDESIAVQIEEVDEKTAGNRSKRVVKDEHNVFGGILSLRTGHVNNLYRDIESLYGFYTKEKAKLSKDFIVLFRMSLRILAETAAKDARLSLADYLTQNFDEAKKGLNKNDKTTLSNQNVEKSKIVQLFQTGAHDYSNSKNEEQALAMSIILGQILRLSHGKSK